MIIQHMRAHVIGIITLSIDVSIPIDNIYYIKCIMRTRPVNRFGGFSTATGLRPWEGGSVNLAPPPPHYLFLISWGRCWLTNSGTEFTIEYAIGPKKIAQLWGGGGEQLRVRACWVRDSWYTPDSRTTTEPRCNWHNIIIIISSSSSSSSGSITCTHIICEKKKNKRK